jgi:hypothetical protein
MSDDDATEPALLRLAIPAAAHRLFSTDEVARVLAHWGLEGHGLPPPIALALARWALEGHGLGRPTPQPPTR